MTSEIMFFIIILALLVYIGITHYHYNNEREKLIKAILAKNLTELTDNEYLEKLKPNKTQTKPPDIVPFDADMDEKLFDKAIKNEIENA